MLPTTTIFVCTLNTLWALCRAVPLIDLKNTLEQNVLDAMAITACSPNGDCWRWLPMEAVSDTVVTVPDDQPLLKLHVRREASSVNPNTGMESWSNNAPLLTRKVHQLALTSKQAESRVSKKDVLMPRSWGAGGMPFSVLYMNPHGSRGNHAGAAQQQELSRTERPSPSVAHPNSRIALRNGSATQPRRQYSIIPQLFISYGWGPFGK